MPVESGVFAHPNKYHVHLVRLVQACGDTLKNHAAEIVGSKSGTMKLQITINVPNRAEGVPTIDVKQTYLSDEALDVDRDWPSAYENPDDARTNTPSDASWVDALKDCCCPNPSTPPETEGVDND